MRCGALLVAIVAACSPPSSSGGPPPSQAVRSFAACFGVMPADWSQRLQVRDLTADFQLDAVSADGRLAYGGVRSTGGGAIAAVDLETGSLSTIAGLPPGAAGIGAMAAALPWLVWEELDSTTDLGDWSVRAWNAQSNALLDLAASRPAGGEVVFGQAPLPVVAHDLAAWAQPLARLASYSQAEVLRYDLGTGQTTVLDAGRVSGPVFAGPDLVWARIGADGSYALRAVDADTLRPVTLPGRVSTPGPVLYLAGSARYLAWISDEQSLHVWRIGTGEYADYTTNLEHPLQFPQIAGDFVLWYAGYLSSVLDLRTGRAFDVPGSLAGSDAVIAGSEPSRAPSTQGDVVPARLSYTPLTAATRIDAC